MKHNARGLKARTTNMLENEIQSFKNVQEWFSQLNPIEKTYFHFAVD